MDGHCISRARQSRSTATAHSQATSSTLEFTPTASERSISLSRCRNLRWSARKGWNNFASSKTAFRFTLLKLRLTASAWIRKKISRESRRYYGKINLTTGTPGHREDQRPKEHGFTL